MDNNDDFDLGATLDTQFANTGTAWSKMTVASRFKLLLQMAEARKAPTLEPELWTEGNLETAAETEFIMLPGEISGHLEFALDQTSGRFSIEEYKKIQETLDPDKM